MTENHKKEAEDQEKNQEKSEMDDLQEYMKEMEILETDFSDLEDLDMEELQEIKDAIAKVKESEELPENDLTIKEILNETNSELITYNEIEEELKDEQEVKETMISDFSDIDEIDFDELKEIQEAIDTVKQEELAALPEEERKTQPAGEISKELEEKIKQELVKRKATEEKEIITPEKFLNYIKEKRDKIWYHALYYLAFNVEDHTASKVLLYDVLKEVTSKSPIDPIPEHQFYFGLGYILRLTLNEKQIVRFLRDGIFKISINVDNLKEMLNEAGEPISIRPVIKEEEKKQMFKDFLEEDFSDIL
ncbi:MAG: hypothetical protein ACFFHD_04025 [Promethearchaeota archaeon]